MIEICSKNHPKIDQYLSKNRPKWVQKSTKIGPKALLESSGGHLGPKMAPRANIGSKTWFVGPPWTSKLEAKIHQKSVRSWSKMWCFLLIFWIDFWSDLVPTWCQLGSQSPPKMELSWLQKPSKRQASKIIKIFKNHCFVQVNGGFEGPKLEPKSIKKWFEKVLNSRQSFEWILDGSWIDFGRCGTRCTLASPLLRWQAGSTLVFLSVFLFPLIAPWLSISAKWFAIGSPSLRISSPLSTILAPILVTL